MQRRVDAIPFECRILRKQGQDSLTLDRGLSSGLRPGMVLQAVVSEQLVPTVDGKIVPAFEIMVCNPAIRNLIREEKTYQIDSVIAAGGAAGMRTMDQSLFALVKEGRITVDTAIRFSIHEEALARRLEAEGLA